MRVAPPPVQFGTGQVHIQAGQLVKHLLVLRSGPDDWTAASQRIMQLSRFAEANLCQTAQVVKQCEEMQT